VKLLMDNKVVKIAKKHKKMMAQVLIRWQMQEGIVVIPKSTNKQRIKENFDVWDFELEKEEMEELDKGFRF